MGEVERNPVADLLKLLDEFNQPWLWDTVRRHIDERNRWLMKVEPSRAQPGQSEVEIRSAERARREAPPVDIADDAESLKKRQVGQSHAENYRLLILQRVREYQRAAELLWEVAPDLAGQLPQVDFFAVTAAESLEITARVQALADQIRDRGTLA